MDRWNCAPDKHPLCCWTTLKPPVRFPQRRPDLPELDDRNLEALSVNLEECDYCEFHIFMNIHVISVQASLCCNYNDYGAF